VVLFPIACFVFLCWQWQNSTGAMWWTVSFVQLGGSLVVSRDGDFLFQISWCNLMVNVSYCRS
jgi:hypothetical protein